MTVLERTPRQIEAGAAPRKRRQRAGSVGAVLVVVIIAIAIRPWLLNVFASARPAAVAAAFVSTVLAALPFLLLGSFASAWVRSSQLHLIQEPLRRWLRSRRLLGRPLLAVPAAVVPAVVPPGSDEAAPLRANVPTGAVLTALLAGPAVSPVVLVATAVAFPGEPLMVLARLLAGIVLAIVIGLLWYRLGRPEWLELSPPEPPEPGGFFTYAREGLVAAGGALVVGALLTALITVAAPASWSWVVGARPVFSVIAVALFAVLVSVPAEATPAVAAGLVAFSPTARLTFLVVGSVVNVRRFSRQSNVYGPALALRLAPATLVVAVLVAGAVGALMLS